MADEEKKLPRVSEKQQQRRLRVLAYERAIREQFPVGGDYVEFFEAIANVLQRLTGSLQAEIDEEGEADKKEIG